MKLLAGLFAATMAIDCPNDSWIANADNDACIPDPDTVTVTCNPTNMVINFNSDHLYVNIDVGEHQDESSSAASVGACTPVVSENGGAYELTIPLDDCDTTVTQEGGLITFYNSIVGDDAALTIDGIITTEKLQLDVTCSYSDEFDLLVSDIGIEAAGHTLGDTGETGDMDSEFTLASYSDASFSNAVSSANNVIIGQPVYNRVSVSGAIPSNVDFVVQGCTAMDTDDITTATATYDIMQNGCLDNLIATTELSSSLRGADGTDVDFSFNGFTFESNSDTLYVECKIVLCATDSNGDFLNPVCGFDSESSALQTACDAAEVSDGSVLGYSLAGAL